MKVLMLGHSGVGKTTYMASMYLELVRGVSDFSLKAQSDHDHLLEMGHAITAGTYPSLTDRRSVYDFDLCYKCENCFPFQWMDYRGGALLYRSSSQEAKELLSDLSEAGAILVFCDCDATCRRDRHDVEDEISRMTYLVGQALEDVGRRVALGLIFTKADLIEDPKKETIELDGELYKTFEGLIQAVNENQKVNGTLIPVACGRRSFNTSLPVLFALHIGIDSEVERRAERIEELEEKAESLQEQVVSLDNLGRWMSGKKTYGKMAEEKLRKARKHYKKMLPLLEPGRALGNYLEGLPRF